MGIYGDLGLAVDVHNKQQEWNNFSFPFWGTCFSAVMLIFLSSIAPTGRISVLLVIDVLEAVYVK